MYTHTPPYVGIEGMSPQHAAGPYTHLAGAYLNRDSVLLSRSDSHSKYQTALAIPLEGLYYITCS